MENTKPSGATPGSLGSFQQDLLASVVVFLVALPLWTGSALASDVPPENAAAVGITTGITTGIVGGLVVGLPFDRRPQIARHRRWLPGR